MKLFKVASFLFLLIGIPSHSHSDDSSRDTAKFQRVSFSEIHAGNASVDSHRRLKVWLINSASELQASFEYLYSNQNSESYGTEPPELDFTAGSAVLLDMGVQGNLGHYIVALRAISFGGQHKLTYATLSPGEGCWAPSQTQRPFQLIYFKEKIDILSTNQIEGYEACDNP